ncbi:MAG TPA: FixH family protein [Roseiflexaceae bacterium]|nr:FixH family protein [Roseiflexaceae bacterium]
MSQIETVAGGMQRAAGGQRQRVLRWIGIGAGAIVLLLAVAVGGLMAWMSYVPADLDLSTTRASAAGAYQVSYTPRRGPIAVNQIHTWTIHVETADGRPVEGATITVDGDMPQHGHGLPTDPQVTQDLGGGDYLVEGLKFHMPGWWVVDFTISGPGQPDTVRFNLLLN